MFFPISTAVDHHSDEVGEIVARKYRHKGGEEGGSRQSGNEEEEEGSDVHSHHGRSSPGGNQLANAPGSGSVGYSLGGCNLGDYNLVVEKVGHSHPMDSTLGEGIVICKGHAGKVSHHRFESNTIRPSLSWQKGPGFFLTSGTQSTLLPL